MDNTESRIAPSPEAASDDFASPLNPPAAAADRLAFEPVPLRYREDGFTPEKQRAYVEALADCGIAREAAARVGLSEQAINRVRRRSDARSFDNACEAAHLFGARRLRSIAFERAVEGTLKGHYYHGERISEERVYDNRLLIYLLGKTAHLLERDEEKSRAICGNWEAHMDALEQGLDAPAPPRRDPPEFTGDEVWKDDDGTWWTSFPPPPGFDGDEQREFGEDYYQRTLSAGEQAVLDAELDERNAEYLAAEAARRDRFFGFAGDELSSPGEAETHETSGPSEAADPDPRPIEYKSAFPPGQKPCPTLSAAMRVHAEARRRGGASPIVRNRASPPAAAADIVHPASPEASWKRGAFRASAPPREPHPDPALRSRHIQFAHPRHPYR